MDETLYYINLYDYYFELLTSKQQAYFEDYYFQNLSLAEIASNHNVSRNAVHKQLKEVENKLNFYEEKLGLIKKATKIKEILKDVDQSILDEIEELI